MPGRFVILHHEAADGEHWDLMLERGGILITWQLSREPVSASSLPIPATRIQDHRMAFLEYEGPISLKRGRVRRVDAGTVQFEETEEDRYEFRLSRGHLTGLFRLPAEDSGFLEAIEE